MVELVHKITLNVFTVLLGSSKLALFSFSLLEGSSNLSFNWETALNFCPLSSHRYRDLHASHYPSFVAKCSWKLTSF